MTPYYFNLLSLIALLCLSTHHPASAQSIHAIWGFAPEGPFSGTPAQTAAALRDNGINAVFVDRLDPALFKTLKASGSKVFTTIQVFGDHAAWTRHPQLRPVNSSGAPLPAKYGSGICPTQRWYWPTILRRVSQKLDAGFDGVWLDFIRFGSYWEDPKPKLEQTCFCDSTLADFSRVTGIVDFVKYTAELTSKPVWPIIQSDLGEEHRVSDEEFAAAVLGALAPPSQGVIIFQQKPLLEARQLLVLRETWK